MPIHTRTHTHTQLPQVHPKVSNASGCDKSFLFQNNSQQSTTVSYVDIITCRRAQNQARSGRRNAEGDVRKERQRLRQAAARAARRYVVTPLGLSCCLQSSFQPTYMHTHTHTHIPGNSTNSPSLFPLHPLPPCRAADAAATEAQRQQRLAAWRETNRRRAAAR